MDAPIDDIVSDLAFLRALAKAHPRPAGGRKPLEGLRRQLISVRTTVAGGPATAILEEIIAELPLYDSAILDLIDVNLLTRGRYPFQRVAIPLREVLLQVSGFLEPKAERLGIHLEEDGTRDEIQVYTDPHALGRALFNIGAHLVFRSRRGATVRLETHRASGEITVRFRAFPTSIAPGELQAAFEELDPREQFTMDQRPGRRRSLYLCRLLVEGTKARLMVHSSSSDSEASVSVSLPLAPTQLPAERTGISVD
jgi:K+-sensing histidine kinase KdpD